MLDQLKAPISKDQEIGILKIETKNDKLEIPVYSSEKIKKVNFIKKVYLHPLTT